MTRPPGPQHTVPHPRKQTRQVQFWWVWVECLDFLRFDFTLLSCQRPGARSRAGACCLNKPSLWAASPVVPGMRPTEPALHGPGPASVPLVLTGPPPPPPSSPSIRILLKPSPKRVSSWP